MALKEYCRGKRQKPAWAIGELDDYGTKDINSINTIFLLKKKTYLGALDALRNGKIYTVLKAKGTPAMMLADFRIYHPNQNSIAYSGDEFKTNSNPTIKIRIAQKNVIYNNNSAKKNKATLVTLKILRQGKLIKEYNQSLPISITYNDDYRYSPGEMIYYRIETTDEKGGKLISNPIFVRFEK
ncbi:MAG TPA: hypothetical protein ENH82_18795 [bacterium]|nr:hypothetical protein [bacterium]